MATPERAERTGDMPGNEQLWQAGLNHAAHCGMHECHGRRRDEGEGPNGGQNSQYDLGRPAAPANKKDNAGNDESKYQQGAKPAKPHHPAHHAHVHHAFWTAPSRSGCLLAVLA